MIGAEQFPLDVEAPLQQDARFWHMALRRARGSKIVECRGYFEVIRAEARLVIGQRSPVNGNAFAVSRQAVQQPAPGHSVGHSLHVFVTECTTADLVSETCQWLAFSVVAP